MQQLKNRYYRIIFVFAAVFILLFAFQEGAFAADHVRYAFLKLDISNIPEEAAYIDILLPIVNDEERYSELNEENLSKMGLPGDCGLALYNDGTFASYTLHMNGAGYFCDIQYSTFQNGKTNYSYATQEFFRGLKNDHLSYVKTEYPEIKIVFADDKGNILNQSSAFTLETRFTDDPIGEVYYNAKTGYISVNGESESGTFFTIMYPLLILPVLIAAYSGMSGLSARILDVRPAVRAMETGALLGFILAMAIFFLILLTLLPNRMIILVSITGTGVVSRFLHKKLFPIERTRSIIFHVILQTAMTCGVLVLLSHVPLLNTLLWDI